MKFDPQKPYNALPLLPPGGLELNTPEILIASIEASEAIGALKVALNSDVQHTVSSLQLMSPLFVPEAVASSGVENINTTNELVYEAKLLADGQIPSVEKEVLNYSDALVHAMIALRRHKGLSTNDIISVQARLEPTKQGIRRVPGTTLKNELTGEVYYTPPVGESHLRTLLGNLETYFNDKAPAAEIYARMAIMHYQFEAIHPFLDGNGRTGRMLMPLYLTVQGRLDYPLLFISRYILAHRDDYYAKLRAVTRDGAWTDWIVFIIKATTEQALYTVQVLERIDDAIETTRDQMRQKLPRIYRAELVEFIFSEPFFSQEDLRQHLKISYVTARKYLAALESEGLVVKRRQANHGRMIYASPKYINILRSV